MSLDGADFDMPQPVHYSHKIDFNFTPASLLERPELAARIALISGLWNEIEARIIAFLAIMANEQAKMAISIFFAVKNDAAKRATIETISHQNLSPADFDRFQEVLSETGKRYNERNTMVHGLWGVSAKYPDKLLWADIKNTTMLHVDMLKMAQPSFKPEEREKRLIQSQKEFVVYSKKDFDDIIARMNGTYEQLSNFSRPSMEQRLQGYARVD